MLQQNLLQKSKTKKAVKSFEFKKRVFYLPYANGKSQPVIVWYSGDKKVAENFCHGNSLKDIPYLTTPKSVRSDIKNNVFIDQSAVTTYMEMSAATDKSKHGMNQIIFKILQDSNFILFSNILQVNRYVVQNNFGQETNNKSKISGLKRIFKSVFPYVMFTL